MQTKITADGVTQSVKNTGVATEQVSSKAQKLLTDLRGEADLRRAINLYGEDSARVAELRLDAERENFKQQLESLDASKEFKENLLSAWDQAKGIASVDLSSQIRGAISDAAAFVQQLRKARDEASMFSLSGIAESVGGVWDNVQKNYIKPSMDGIEAAFQEIAKHEGFRSKAYWDVNHYRAGYGSDTGTDPMTGRKFTIQKDTQVTRAEADADLKRRIQEYFVAISNQIGAETFAGLTAEQKASLASIVHNYGAGDFRPGGDLGGVLKALRGGTNADVADAIRALGGGGHTGAIGETLKRRRADEAGAFGPGTGKSEAIRETEQLKQNYQQLMAAYDPLVSIQNQYKDSMKTISDAERSGAITAAEAASAREHAAAKMKEETLSIESQSKEAFDNLSASLDPYVAATRELEQAQMTVNKALSDGAITASQASEAMAQAQARYQETIGKIGEGGLKSDLSEIESGFNSISGAISGAIVNNENLGDSVKNTLKQIAQSFIDSGIQGLFKNLFSGLAGANSGGGIFGALFGGGGLPGFIPGFASGTNYAPGGVALVGEKGPELVNLPRGSKVLTNAATRRAMGGEMKFSPNTVVNIQGDANEKTIAATKAMLAERDRRAVQDWVRIYKQVGTRTNLMNG